MRANSLLGAALALAACLFFLPTARAQVDGCPQDICVESETTLVFDPQTNVMHAFTTATTDYNTALNYTLCVDLAVGRLNGPYLVNATNLQASGNPWCTPGAAQVERPGDVPATPGRQYYAVGLAALHVFVPYDVIVPVPTCGLYCEGYWYDAFGYSQLITTQPSSADWPSIVYTYPLLLVPVPVYAEEIAMSGSTATAWSPPVIYSVTPNQWPAGVTTTFTISGAGFGYSPDLTIGGTGIVVYTNGCTAAPGPSCDTQIVATVTLDANTPGGLVETITVTANGLNPSGYLPVQVAGQSGQATAQATTQASALPVPEIWFNNVNVTGIVNPTCPGDVRCVVIGQQIALTIKIPSGITATSHEWTRPTGTVVGGYTPTPQNFEKGEVIEIPNSGQGCQHLDQDCLTFYWVTPSTAGTPWQVSYKYTYNNQPSQTVTAKFSVAGPSGLQVSGPTGVPNVYNNATYGPTMGFILLFNNGIQLTAAATNPPGAQGGTFSWVQLLTAERSTIREGGPYAGTGVVGCIPLFFAQDPAPVLDTKYPASTGYTFTDAPKRYAIGPAYEGDVAGEFKLAQSFSTYLMWNPNLSGSIPVPFGSVAWQWACDAVNTLSGQATGTNWTRLCAAPQTPGSAQFSPGASFPRWSKVALSPNEQSCQYQ